MTELTNRNGQRLWRVLNLVYVAVLGVTMWLLWSHVRNWMAIIATILVAVAYLILLLWTADKTKMMKDCPECGRVLRFDPGSIYRMHSVGGGLTTFNVAQAIVQSTERKNPKGLTRDPSLHEDSWVCDRCGYTLSLSRQESWKTML